MTLYIIGTGLNDEKSITVAGLEAIRESEAVYMENYTSLMNVTPDSLENFYGKKITVVDRKAVEQDNGIVSQAKEKKVAFSGYWRPVWGNHAHRPDATLQRGRG